MMGWRTSLVRQYRTCLTVSWTRHFHCLQHWKQYESNCLITQTHKLILTNTGTRYVRSCRVTSLCKVYGKCGRSSLRNALICFLCTGVRTFMVCVKNWFMRLSKLVTQKKVRFRLESKRHGAFFSVLKQPMVIVFCVPSSRGQHTRLTTIQAEPNCSKVTYLPPSLVHWTTSCGGTVYHYANRATVRKARPIYSTT